MNIRKKFTRCLKFILKTPSISFFVIVLLSTLCLGPFFYALIFMEPGITVDSSLNSFLVKNLPAALNFDGFRMINKRHLSSLKILEMSNGVKKRGERIKDNVCQSIFEIIYKSDDNIYLEDNLIYINKVENDIMKLKDYEEYCWRDSRDLCKKPYRWNSLFTEENFKSLLPFYHKLRKGNVIKTFIKFRNLRLPPRLNLNHGKKFIENLIKLLKYKSNEKIQILYSWNDIIPDKLKISFWSDINLSILSFVFVFLIMFVLTSFSLFLTIMGIWAISLSFAVTIFVYRVIFNEYEIRIFNGAALFVIIGIGN